MGEIRSGAVVEDVTYAGTDGLGVEAYLIRPDWPADAPAAESGPGILFWHWLDTSAPDGNRTQCVDEATALARAGVVSLLPQGRFPWTITPSAAAADARAIDAEVGRMRAGIDLLVARDDVDPDRLAVVGHDFGGMLAAVEAADETRLRALVLIAATPRWGDWFLPFWEIADDRIDYLRALRPVDPIERIGDAAPASVLFQFGTRDFYIASMTGREFHAAAPPDSQRLEYETGHDMRLPKIRSDRLAFLANSLGFSAELAETPGPLPAQVGAIRPRRPGCDRRASPSGARRRPPRGAC
jgi:dienelactone hydrolase